MKNIDRYIAIGFIIIGAIFFSQTFELPENSRAYPRILIGIMVLLAVLLLIKTFFKTSTSKTWKELFGHIQWPRFGFAFLASFAYLFLINIMGFFTATVVYLLGSIFFLKGSRLTMFIAIPVFTLALFLIFRVFLKVPLPTGFLI